MATVQPSEPQDELLAALEATADDGALHAALATGSDAAGEQLSMMATMMKSMLSSMFATMPPEAIRQALGMARDVIDGMLDDFAAGQAVTVSEVMAQIDTVSQATVDARGEAEATHATE